MCIMTTLKTTLTQCETEMLGPERPSHIVAQITKGPARSRGPSGPTAHAIPQPIRSSGSRGMI